MLLLIKKTTVPTIAMIWATIYFFEVSRLPAKNGYLIRPVYYIMLSLYIVNTITDFLQWKRVSSKEEKKVNKETKPDSINNLITIGVVFIVTIIYVSIMKTLGFVVSTTIYLFVELYILKTKNKLVLFGLPIILTLVVFFMFTKGFSVPLPRGFLGF